MWLFYAIAGVLGYLLGLISNEIRLQVCAHRELRDRGFRKIGPIPMKANVWPRRRKGCRNLVYCECERDGEMFYVVVLNEHFFRYSPIVDVYTSKGRLIRNESAGRTLH